MPSLPGQRSSAGGGWMPTCLHHRQSGPRAPSAGQPKKGHRYPSSRHSCQPHHDLGQDHRVRLVWHVCPASVLSAVVCLPFVKHLSSSTRDSLPTASGSPRLILTENQLMSRPAVYALIISSSLAASALAQTPGPTSGTQTEKPASPELASCKATALRTLSISDPGIKDIYFDEDGITMATAETSIEGTPITRVIMGQASFRSDKTDSSRSFLCLIGEKGKVLLTFFTAR